MALVVFRDLSPHTVFIPLTVETVKKMTAIKHALQRDIFTPNDERLLSIVNVCKAGKKKKNCFLCATGKGLPSSSPDSLWGCIHPLWNMLGVMSTSRAEINRTLDDSMS